RTPPRDWGLRLPDLLSRMQAAGLARLDEPDDALLSAVLVKLFADRQIAVPVALIGWLVSRMERSIAAARDLVAQLDARALAEGRPVSRALAAELLDERLDSPGGQ
ncbi:MAG: chromosomal replication initiator DnaA, partial [Rhodobacteraceae bacterium]|nr:chromosomal replication initiator DnaA [Paracoccaceae bacterium]